MEKENPSCRKIMETAWSLFGKHGIRRISIEEICREADVSKVTFYKYFQNKPDLVARLYEAESARAMEHYQAIFQKSIPFEEKIRESIRFKSEQTRFMSHEFMQDVIQSDDPGLQRLYHEKIQEGIRMFIEILEQAKMSGEIRSDVDLRFVLYFMNHMIEMLNDEQLKAMFSKPQELFEELSKLMFYGILTGRGR